jgi:Zn-dependent protease
MPTLTILQTLLIYAIPILFAITVHEVAHGWVANKLGDPTARLLGRLTLNPIKHIDLIGTIIVPAALYFTTGFIFGWAKPVPIGWRNLRSPRRDVALVASAGPLANLIMALLWGFIIKLGILLYASTEMGIAIGMVDMGKVGMQINLILLVLNLIPLPPLDGSRVMASLLPAKLAAIYLRIEPFGFVILILLLTLQVLLPFLSPIVNTLGGFIVTLFGLGGS